MGRLVPVWGRPACTHAVNLVLSLSLSISSLSLLILTSDPFVVGAKVGGLREASWKEGIGKFLLDRYFRKMALRSLGLARIRRYSFLSCALLWRLRGSPARPPAASPLIGSSSAMPITDVLTVTAVSITAALWSWSLSKRPGRKQMENSSGVIEGSLIKGLFTMARAA